MSDLKFPNNFIWGAAINAHQVEGDNFNNDWWTAEQQGLIPYQSGEACAHKKFFKQDIDAAAHMNLNAYRFSIEWSRVEPEINKFNEEEFIHYREKIIQLRERGLEPIVTLNHFTLPLWLSNMGGWQNPKSVAYFERYVSRCVQEFGDYVNFWLTFNEPNIYIKESYLNGSWPPFKKNWWSAARVLYNIVHAHKKAYWLIKKNNSVNAVSVAYNFVNFIPAQKSSIRDRIGAKLLDLIFNNYFILLVKEQLDFIGVNYYLHQRVHLRKFRLQAILPASPVLTDNGNEIRPFGLLQVLRKVKKYRKPILITGNGLADKLDRQRSKYIRSHLLMVYTAIAEGIDIRGYIYNSLMDGFEWHHGFIYKFGLIKIHPISKQRYIRRSAYDFADIAGSNKLKRECIDALLKDNPDTYPEILKRQLLKISQVQPEH